MKAAKQKAEQELARQNMPRTRQALGRGDARHDGWNSAPRQKVVDNRVGDMSKVGMIRTSSTGGLGLQTSQFNSIRSMSSRTRNTAGNTLTRHRSGKSSRTATPGIATPPSVTSTNSLEYVRHLSVINGSIFRHESESKDDDYLLTTPAQVQKVVVPEDEVADGGYYTSPPLNVVASIASVPNFIVGRKGYGTISFISPVDLTDIPSLTILREIVEIKRGIATVYLNESKNPRRGQGLNVPTEVTLENVRPPPDFEGDEYIEVLRATPHTNFLSYNLKTGLWVFTVEHFSSYGTGWETSSSSSSASSRSSSPITFYRGNRSTGAVSSYPPSLSTISELRATLQRPTLRRTHFTGPDVPVTDQQLRSTTRKETSTVATPSAGGDPTARYIYLSREQEAEKLFRTLVKELIKTGKPPNQGRTDELNTYSDVMTLDKVYEWKYSEQLRHGMLWDDDRCTVTFIALPGHIHEMVSNDVREKIVLQFPPRMFSQYGSTSELSLYIYADANRIGYTGR